jgi:hypothetical protein
MKTSTHFSVNSLLLMLGIMVLCPGQNSASAQAIAPASQAKAQLHVPWKLLSERLSAVINRRQADGSPSTTQLGNRLISVPYDGEALNWILSSGTISATANLNSSSVFPSGANVSINNGKIHIVLDALTLDQVLERNVGGVTVRVHLNANCGPIVIDQPSASSLAAFSLNWANGSPVATLTSLDLSWAANSWVVSDFACTGPSGVDSLVRDGLSQFLRDPASLKPYVQSYVGQNLQASIDATLAKVRDPFAVGSGAESITVTVGSISPASTGIVADLSLRSDAKSLPLPALPIPSDKILASLSTLQPVLVGDKSVIEFILATRLAAKPAFFQVNLQTVSAFHKLMQSRFAQFFIWSDLWNFPKNSPFYLNVVNPRALSLTHSSGTSLSSTVPLSAVIQAYRDSTWWTYVTTTGTAPTTVALSVKSGVMSYATTIDSLKIKSAIGAAYAKKYNKKSNSFPDSLLSKAIAGPQRDLSGSMKWPDIDLQEAGQYRASSLTWADKNTFSLNFSALAP